MVVCCIIGCKNRSKYCFFSPNVITFHRFPKDPERKKKWTSATGKPNWSPTSSSRICSEHFKEEYFETINDVRNLVKTAIPTINIYKFYSDDAESEVFLDIPKGKELIARVYNYLHNEYEQLKKCTGNSCDLSFLANILKRTAKATGVSEHTITAILDENKKDVEGSTDVVPAKRQKLNSESNDGVIRPFEQSLSSAENTASSQQSIDSDGECLHCEIKIEPETIGPPTYQMQDYGLCNIEVEMEKLEEQPTQIHSLPQHVTTETSHVTVKYEPECLDSNDTDFLDTQGSSFIANHHTSKTTLITVKCEPIDDEIENVPDDVTRKSRAPQD